MKINQQHAIWRIGQISDICLTRIQQEQETLNAEVVMLQDAGFDVEPEGIKVDHTSPDSFYHKWNKLIEFYSQFL